MIIKEKPNGKMQIAIGNSDDGVSASNCPVVWDEEIDKPVPDIASQAEAQAGTNNTKFMTPLRVAQANNSQRPLKTYTSYSQLGLSIDNGVTIPQICQAMETGSYFTITVYESQLSKINNVPEKGELVIYKLVSSEAFIEHIGISKNMYCNYWNLSQGFGSWVRCRTDNDEDNAYQRNGRYRGKSLGTIASVSQANDFVGDFKISNGTFNDMYLGDEITLQEGTYNAKWLVAGLDIRLNYGDTSTSQHHVALIPKTPLYNVSMNDTNITTGGYKGSKMFTTELPALDTKLKNILGTHLLKRRALLSAATNTSVTSGGYSGWSHASSSWEWTDVYSCLLSEVEVYGSRVFSSSGYDIGGGSEKLPIFNFINPIQFSRWGFWLRAVASSTGFCFCGGLGYAYYHSASDSYGVRPLILLG